MVIILTVNAASVSFPTTGSPAAYSRQTVGPAPSASAGYGITLPLRGTPSTPRLTLTVLSGTWAPRVPADDWRDSEAPCQNKECNHKAKEHGHRSRRCKLNGCPCSRYIDPREVELQQRFLHGNRPMSHWGVRFRN